MNLGVALHYGLGFCFWVVGVFAHCINFEDVPGKRLECAEFNFHGWKFFGSLRSHKVVNILFRIFRGKLI